MTLCEKTQEYRPMTLAEWAELKKILVEYKDEKKKFSDNFFKQDKAESEIRKYELEFDNAETNDERKFYKYIISFNEIYADELLDQENIFRYNFVILEKLMAPLLVKFFNHNINFIHKELGFKKATEHTVKIVQIKCRYNVYDIADSIGIIAIALNERYLKFLESYNFTKFNRDNAIKLFSKTQDISTRTTKNWLNKSIIINFQNLIISNSEHTIESVANKEGLTPELLCRFLENAKGAISRENQIAEWAEMAIKKRTQFEQKIMGLTDDLKMTYFASLRTFKYLGILTEKIITTYAETVQVNKDILIQIAKEEGLIPRDYRISGMALTGNLKSIIENHPDAFNIIIYLPDVLPVLETPAAGENMVEQTYADPIHAMALKLPGESPYKAIEEGDHADGFMMPPVVLMINMESVPKHSVIQYEDYTASPVPRLIAHFVFKSEAVSQAPGWGQKHYCIPFPNFMNEGGG